MLPTSSSRTWRSDLFWLSISILGFYLLWLNAYPLFNPDEGRYVEVAREMVVTRDFVTPRVNSVVFLDKPVLYYWLSALAISLFGLKEWAMRLFPMLLGVAGCLITYINGRLLFGRRTGLLAALILATTPLYFGAAHYANLDLEVSVWISASLLFFITALQNKTPHRQSFLLAGYICMGLAFLTKGLIGLVFPIVVIGSWVCLLRKRHLLKRMHLLVGILIVVLIGLPWYALVQRANPEFLHYFFVTQQVTRFLSSAVFNNPTPFWFYLPVIALGFFPWILFLPGIIKETLSGHFKQSSRSSELYLLLWFSIVFIFFSIPRSKTVGYILPLLPALSLLCAIQLNAWWHTKKPYLGVCYGISAFLIATLLMTLFIYHHFNFLPRFTPTLVAMIILILSAAWLAWMTRKRAFIWLFSIMLVTNALALSILLMGAEYLNTDSSKQLAYQLKKIIRPQDEVVHYFKYFYDLPVYLEKQGMIVSDWQNPSIPFKDNWVREFWNGHFFHTTDAILMNETTFWNKWQDKQRLFVFINANYLKKFRLKTTQYFLIAQDQDIILISNQPVATRV